MAKNREVLDAGLTLLVLQIVVAAFLITLGLIGIVYWKSDLARFGRGLNRAFGGANSPMGLIASIAELAAGVIVLVGVFQSVRSRLLYGATLVIAILWVIQIVVIFFTRSIFEPNLLIWLNRLAADLIVLLALWLVNRKYA
jgi:hypothetical protein